MIDIKFLKDPLFQRQYPAGTRIQSAGEKEMYIVVSGKVDLYTAEAEEFRHTGSAGPGQPFGEPAFFGEDKGTVYITSVPTVLFVIGESTFDRVAMTQPWIMHGLLKAAYETRPVQQPVATAASKDAMRGVIKQKLNSQVDQDNVAKVRDAFRQKYAAEKTKDDNAPTAVEKDFPRDVFPEGHKSYPNITRPEQLKFLYKQEMTCPNCGKKFEGVKIFESRLVPSRATRYDLRKYYRDFDPAWYDVLTCPHCMFSMLANMFAETAKLSKPPIQEALNTVRSSVALDFDAERDIDFVFAQHYIALQCTKGYLSHNQLDMRLWAGISWLYEDAGDRGMEQYAAGKSAEMSDAIYQTSKLNPMQEQMILMNSAGMYYRTGDFDKARNDAFKVKTLKEGKKSYVDLAERLMEQIAEDKHKQ